jgi:hypothetical protein
MHDENMNAKLSNVGTEADAPNSNSSIEQLHAAREDQYRKIYESLRQRGYLKEESLQGFLTNSKLSYEGIEESGFLPSFENVETAWSGDLRLETPKVAEVLPDKFMLYRGRMNEQHGEPGIGKSNVALLFAILEMQAGHDVLFIDPEDTCAGLCRRLASFGANRDSVVKHLHYLNPRPADFWKLQAWATIKIPQPSLVILDGLASCMSSANLDEDNAKEFLQFSENYLRPFLISGAAVLVTDHVVKSKESRGRHSRGSGAKLGEWDGVVYEIELAKAYTPTEAGALRLKVCKDRNGGVGKIGDTALEIHFTPSGNEVNGLKMTSFRFALPSRGEFSPTRCMEAVSRYLEINPEAKMADVREMGGFRAAVIDQSLLSLEQDGFLKIHKGGPGKANRYEVLKPFREMDGGSSNEQQELS